ncbi:MAG: trypsin-like peptidase domain-containing protein, partial [Loktanella sp.]|nr:trypsin-like peptidase domain-containing protein [Loktanella sp.]
MAEYSHNSESSYSQTGERSSSTPITVAFRNESAAPAPQPGAPKKSSTVLKMLAAGVLIVGLSIGGGAFGAYLVKDNTPAPIENVPQTSTPISTSVGSQIPSVDLAATTAKGSYTVVAEHAKPTVVEITTEMVTNNSFFQQFVQSGAGSGVIISADGYIITNNHVIDGASKITVRLTTGTEYAATLIGTDSQSDIAVLKVDAAGLPFATIGDSSKLMVGQEVVAIGNPLGELGGSVTNGIVSALDREITVDGQKMRLLQTNAAINPGNSGGGLFNMNGELIAIVNAKSSGEAIEGLGFAIPINYAHEVAQELLKNGYVSGRPAMGISYIAIDDYMDLMRYGVPSYGIYVDDGGETSLQNGDRIVRIGDY